MKTAKIVLPTAMLGLIGRIVAMMKWEYLRIIPQEDVFSYELTYGFLVFISVGLVQIGIGLFVCEICLLTKHNALTAALVFMCALALAMLFMAGESITLFEYAPGFTVIVISSTKVFLASFVLFVVAYAKDKKARR